MIDPHSGVPQHRQLADELRARIASGEWTPGSLLPPQPRLRHEYGVGKATLQAAVAALRAEGLVDVERGVGVRVRGEQERETVRVPRGATLISRMPTGQERAELGIPEGVPVMEVRIGGRVQMHPADRVVLTFA